MTVGERILRRREELGLTMEELAEKVGVTKSTVNKYEKGQIDMKVSTIRSLHDVLGLSYIELLDDDENTEELEVTTAYFRASDEKQETVRAVLRLPEKVKTPARSGSAG